MDQSIICIAGAHRSGTSVLTRLLHRCGLYLGPENELMPPAADNPDGFWEHLRLVKLNDEVLNAVGAAWDLPPPEKERFGGDALRPMRAKARLIIDEFAGWPVWGWKDPRNVLTLPFWQSLLPDLKTVLIIRNPLEVAYSMNKRNGTSYALGLRLWEIYNRRLLADSNPDKRLMTHYPALFADPEGELKRIAAFIGLTADDKVADAASLVNRERRHTTFTVEQMIDAGVSEPIVKLYTSLLKGTAGKEPGKAGSKLAAGGESQLSGSESQLRTFVPENEAIRQELASRRGAEKQHREETARHQETIERLRQELAAKSVKAAAEINQRDGRIEELQKAYAHLDHLLQGEQEQRTRLFAEFERVRQETWDKLETVRQQLDGHERREKAAREQLEDYERREKAARGQLDDYERQEKAAREQLTRDQEEIALLRQQTERSQDALQRAHQQDEGRRNELTELRERFVQTNGLLQKTTIRLTDFESRNLSLTNRLRKQLLEMKKLLRLLDQIGDAADLLRNSRRWKLANPFASLLAPLTGKALPGFGHLDKNVEKYRAWKESHPEVAALPDEIQALRPREILSPIPGAAADETLPSGSNPSLKPPPPKDPVSFVRPDQPEVSIIIPVYNQVDFTHACLAAVQANGGDIPFEVIIVDDASTDETQEVIGAIPGLVYLRAEENSGFIAACNRGAAAARGNYLVFLNNDTTVTAGWLEALRETFDLEPKAGLVGSKLVYPDGRLQEAGGIIWRDASGWNRGKFQDPAQPEYNYLREADYCSAASVMIPKALFDRLGGFDPKFAPAYYEDTDLAFRVAQAGQKVFYQPLSVVVHYEGVTSGTDLSSGAKRYQDINRQTFVSTWDEVLAGKPENGDVLTYEKLAAGKKRILVIDHHLPMPDRDSGSLRMFQLVTILRQLGHRITFLPDNLADIPPYGDDLRKRGIEVMHHPHLKSVRTYLEKHGKKFDFIILSRCDFARKHISEARAYAPQARLIFDTVDLHFLREERLAEMVKDEELLHQAKEKKQLEYSLIDQADQTWVVSPAEQQMLQAVRPNSSIAVVSNIVDVPGSATPFAHRRDILFIGSFQHPPNTDAILFFTEEIFPLIQKQIPAIRFYIIGDKAPPEVVSLACEEIIVTGFQPDVAPFFNTIKLSVAPLRYGAGVKGKINQSMGFGVPVVATSLAVEGMSLRDGAEVLIADEPASFAGKVIELYQSEELWDRISRKGIIKTEGLFSVQAARAQLSKLIGDRCDGEPPVSPLPRAPFSHQVTVPALRPT